MADDADSTGDPARPRDDDRCPATTHARTDRQSAGRSVETTPESLYLWQIAFLEARTEALQQRVDQREQDLQHVIDHYEGVLDERQTAPDGELLTDGGTPSERPDGLARRALARVRSLFD